MKLFILILLFSPQIFSKYKYGTSFGNCPSRSAGRFVLDLIHEFEKHPTLGNLKNQIVKNNLKEKYYISEYKVEHRPLKEKLHFDLKCATPLIRVQLYDQNPLDSQYAIFTDTGELHGPAYEKLLREEKKLTGNLPSLALHEKKFDKTLQKRIIEIMDAVEVEIKEKISELIIDGDNELTMILSVNGNPSSVFIGKRKWMDKIKKLERIFEFMRSKNNFPGTINLTNHKKVVVKFK